MSEQRSSLAACFIHGEITERIEIDEYSITVINLSLCLTNYTGLRDFHVRVVQYTHTFNRWTKRLS